jgi:5'-deoxynucleotidase YfbR-like HD superfamily hydrolase
MIVNWIETYTGKKFYPQNPNAEDIDISDIAHSLSNKCRYTGATYRFYSVAQHSVHVCEFVPEPHKLEALLHDATEAYFPDIPFTMRPFLKELLTFEEKIHEAVAVRFNLEYPWPNIVDQVDREIIADEARCLMHTQGVEWLNGRTGFAKAIIPWTPRDAERAFLEKFSECLATREPTKRPADPYHMRAAAREHARQVVQDMRDDG